jgi:hypothetical protein
MHQLSLLLLLNQHGNDPAAGSITVTAPLGSEYTYSIDGTTFQISPAFTGLIAGSYTVSVINSTVGSCTSTSLVDLTAPSNCCPTVIADVTQPTCANPTGYIEVTAPLGAEYT